MGRILSLCLVAAFFFCLFASQSKASEKMEEKIIMDHFSDDKYVYLYRGFGSSDYTFGRIGKFKTLEVDKWFHSQGIDFGFKSDMDHFSEDHIFSFSPTLVYAARYAGGLMWDHAHGIVKIKITKKDFLKYSQQAKELHYIRDTPISARNGLDVYDTYMGPDHSLKNLPFIGTIYPTKGSIYGSNPIPLEKNNWANTCRNALPRGYCGAIEVRITLGAILEMTKAPDPLVIERVSWNEYVNARRDYFHYKGVFWDQGIAEALKSFETEVVAYAEVCGMDEGNHEASFCPLQEKSESAMCEKVCGLHKMNPKSFLFTNERTNTVFLRKISMKFKKAKDANRIENFCNCK